jgi:uncharacterized OB-fold protein
MSQPEKDAAAADAVPEKPRPTITEENRPFWDAARAGELRMQRCAGCGHVRNPIQALCPVCLSESFDWALLSGRGEVFARVVYHRAFHPAYRGDVPYNVVIVQLAEGPRMFSNVIDADNDEIRVGDPLEVVFDRIDDDLTVPRFRPVTKES